MSYRLAFIEEINTEGIVELWLVPRYFSGTPYVGDAGLSLRGIRTPDGTQPMGLVSVSPASRALQPWRWQCSHATPVVEVVPDALDTSQLRRGSVWQLVAYTRASSGVLWTGILQSVKAKKDASGYRLELPFVDLASMATRASPDADGLTLFSYAGTTVAEDGGGYGGGSTLTVTSTADFFARTVAGASRGLVRVEPTGGTPFLARWTAKTATTLTISGSGEYGTTITAAASASPVVSLGYYEGHPARFAQEVYTGESATASRGIADSGYLRLPADLWHQPDSDTAVSRYPGLEYGFWTDAPVQMEAISDWLGRGGFWVTTRAGRVTCRTFPDVGAWWSTRVDPEAADHVLAMEDLAVRSPGEGPLLCETSIFGDSRWPQEYATVTVTTQAGSASTPSAGVYEKRAYPTLDAYVVDLDNTEEEVEEIVTVENGGIASGSSYEVNWVQRTRRIRVTRAQIDMPQGGPAMYAAPANRSELADRLSPWVVYAPQVVRCTMAGPHPEYTVGDSVEFGEDWDLPSAVGGTLAGLYGMIAAVTSDPVAHTCRVEVWLPAQRRVAFSGSGAVDPQV